MLYKIWDICLLWLSLIAQRLLSIKDVANASFLRLKDGCLVGYYSVPNESLAINYQDEISNI